MFLCGGMKTPSNIHPNPQTVLYPVLKKYFSASKKAALLKVAAY